VGETWSSRSLRRFEGKVALVTGATSGIGRATALAFAREGAQVVVSGRRKSAGDDTVRRIGDLGGDSVFVQADITVHEDVARLVGSTVDTYGRVDCAFNNAGYLGAIAAVSAQDIVDYERTMATNVLGTLLCLRCELAVMLEAGSGAIVNNASLAGLVGSPDNSIYSASKHAVVGLTQSIALEVASRGIRINAVCASSVETDMDEHFRAGKGMTDEDLAQMMPIGRLCRAEEVAPAVLFLCSNEASYITGTTITIDGGFSAR
jgi:NAD(P)-dependent dehydrogenase (short-subunit alcohol dehydrogenase family)